MKRIQSLDILRGATIALMVLVNNPGSWKIGKRALLLIALGLLLNLIGCFVRGKGLAFYRFTGVLQRFGLCFALAAAVVCSLPHKVLPWLSGSLLLAYEGILSSAFSTDCLCP